MSFLDMPGISDAGGTDIGDNISHSLMLDSGGGQFFTRVFGTASSPTSWAFSLWIKRGKLSAALNVLFGSGTHLFYMPAADTLITYRGGAVATSSNVFRDPTAHDHLCVISNGTTVKVYHNLVEVSSYTGTLGAINSAATHFIGRDPASAALYGDGLFSQIIFADVAGKAPTDFARISADTGQVVNKTYTGTYGANGFKLEFANPSALGTDTSGNGNNWTTNGGITSANQYTDTPTDNKVVWNPLAQYGLGSLSKGNTVATTGASVGQGLRTSLAIPKTGKWSLRVTPASASNHWIGVTDARSYAAADINTSGANSVLYYGTNGNKYVNGVSTAYGAAYTTEQIEIVVDSDANTVTFWRAGVSQGSITLPSSSIEYAFVVANAAGAAIAYTMQNSGYTPQQLAKIIGTANLPTPVIPDPTKHIYVATIAKSGNTNFTLPWSATDYDTRFKIKIRNTTGSPAWIDGLRGYDKVLFSDTTAAEITNANYITVSGTTITLGSALPDGSYVIEAMKAGLVSARQTNTNGSITSTVSANQLSGFSIVLTTGTGVNATWGHGLLKAPDFMALKKRSAAIHDWNVWHSAFNGTDNIFLNGTGVKFTDATFFNGTPTATLVNVGTSGGVNGSGQTYVAYCHHSVEGYSKFFSSTRNALAEGTFDNCGIKPISLTTKAYTTTGNWVVIDDKRDTYNVCSNQLYQNANTAETVATTLDITATGAKYRTASDPNAAQGYINAVYGYPTKFATAR